MRFRSDELPNPAAVYALRQYAAELPRVFLLSYKKIEEPCFMRDNESISSMYADHILDLRAYLVRKVACRETACDLAQETFLRVISADLGWAIRDPRALLFRIAKNLAIDHYRAHALLRGKCDDLAECEELPSGLPGPEQIVFSRQMLERLCRAIETLPPQCRKIFLLHKFEGQSHAEIAAGYGITRNAVEKHLVRALVHLRKHCAEFFSSRSFS